MAFELNSQRFAVGHHAQIDDVHIALPALRKCRCTETAEARRPFHASPSVTG